MIVTARFLDIICYGKSSAQLTLPSWFTDWVSKLPQTLVIEREGDDLYTSTSSFFLGEASHRTLGFIEFVNNGLMLKPKCFQFEVIDEIGVAEPVCQEDSQSVSMTRPARNHNKPIWLRARDPAGNMGSLILNRRRYRTFTDDCINATSLAFEAADQKALPQESKIFLERWCRRNR